MPEHLLQPGATLMIEGRAFTISGVFAAPDTIFAGELWVDLQALMAATRRSTISSVVVACDSATLDDLETFTLLRLDLELVAISEAAYFADRGRFFAPIRSMAWMTALLIAGGAIFGGLNTFHAAFAARSREAATVQAIGFPRRAVLLSFLSEACLVSVIGTLAATAAAVCLLDGRAVDVPGGTFTLSIDLPTLALGLGVGLVLGPVGALLPAWRCLKPPLPAALRSA